LQSFNRSSGVPYLCRSISPQGSKFTARETKLNGKVSIHADPTFFNPFVWGYAHERGAGPGLGANLNIPLLIGTMDDGYIQALGAAEKTIRAFAPVALVVALGLDASEHDPLAGLAVTTEGFRRIGGAIARLGLPTVFVQEGGYLSEILGANLTAVLAGFEEVR
jgi:acetoin utilization deacetylase AcuC-like enzyme